MAGMDEIIRDVLNDRNAIFLIKEVNNYVTPVTFKFN